MVIYFELYRDSLRLIEADITNVEVYNDYLSPN